MSKLLHTHFRKLFDTFKDHVVVLTVVGLFILLSTVSTVTSHCSEYMTPPPTNGLDKINMYM